jgi:imidazolonepropionase-like amidohydrolase
LAIEAGVDTFEHQAPTREEIELAAERGITWIPTVAVSVYYQEVNRKRLGSDDPAVVARAERELAESEEYLARKRESIGHAMEVGLPLAAGSDAWTSAWRDRAMAMELQALVDHGCTPTAALRAATGWAAAAMGWDEIGTLAAGKLADVIAVAGDPLADIGAMRDVALVVREGVVVKG